MDPIDILKAPHVGIRELKSRLSRYMHKKTPTVATDNGKPLQILMPYDEAVAMLELLADVADRELGQVVRRGAEAVRRGAKGVPARPILEKLRKA